jgi:hypothetical protein
MYLYSILHRVKSVFLCKNMFVMHIMPDPRIANVSNVLSRTLQRQKSEQKENQTSKIEALFNQPS